MEYSEDGIELKQYAVTIVTWVDACDENEAMNEVSDLFDDMGIDNYDVLQIDEHDKED